MIFILTLRILLKPHAEPQSRRENFKPRRSQRSRRVFAGAPHACAASFLNTFPPLGAQASCLHILIRRLNRLERFFIPHTESLSRREYYPGRPTGLCGKNCLLNTVHFFFPLGARAALLHFLPRTTQKPQKEYL